ncbi:MAG: 50S ribosomal protein L9 [Clostridia bacterium]
MKVILLKDVENLGNEGEVVNVADGYGRNYLIPREFAVEATKTSMEMLERRKAKEEKKAEEELSVAQELKEKIESTEVTMTVKAGENGRLFGSVTSKDINNALTEQGIDIDRRKMQMDEPIREVGEKAVPIKLHKDVVAELKVKVVSE